MRILVTAFYRDSARYFAELAKHIERTRNINVTLEAISVYPCAQKFFDDNGIKSTYAPKIPRKTQTHFSTIDENLVKRLISFHSKTYRYFGKNRDEKLTTVAHGYITYMDDLFRRERFDRVIVFGSSRLLPKVVELTAEKQQVPVLYFEQAPFGRTILNTGGVGSKMSLPPPPKRDSRTAKNYAILSGRSAKVHYWKFQKKTLALRIAQANTIVQSCQPRLFQRFLPPDLFSGPANLLLRRALAKARLKFAKKTNRARPSTRRISLFLQTPVDAQFFEESHIYDTFTDIVEDVIRACPQDYQLIVREHPEHLGCYHTELYNLIKNKSNVVLDNTTSFNEVINNSELVIINNSTVGFQALAIGKKVIVLGNAFYSGRGFTYDLSNRAELPVLIQRALSDQPNPDRAKEFVTFMLNDVFFSGHFQDYDLEFDERLVALLVEGSTSV